MDAVERLRYEYPSTLEDVDKIDHYTRIAKCKSIVHELFGVVDPANRYGVPEVLPWAFYACCRHLSVTAISRPTTPFLSREDLQTCLGGREQLLRIQAIFTSAWLHMDCPSQAEQCNV